MATGKHPAGHLVGGYRGQGSELWQTVESGEVPAHYVAQVQHQLMVSGAAVAHLWVFDGTLGLLHEIRPDPALHDRIRAAWDAFAEFLDRDTPPPLADADQRQRDDEAWHLAAKAYQTAKAEADQATAGVDATRAALVALARHLRESGACVSVTGFRKAGAVDYKRVVELKGVDLEKYRGKAREEVRVTVGLPSRGAGRNVAPLATQWLHEPQKQQSPVWRTGPSC